MSDRSTPDTADAHVVDCASTSPNASYSASCSANERRLSSATPTPGSLRVRTQTITAARATAPTHEIAIALTHVCINASLYANNSLHAHIVIETLTPS
jgi:hypothetical protein